MIRHLSVALALVALPLVGGCAYSVGSGLVAGALDEVAGDGRSKGAMKLTDELLEKELLAELGHQLGSGLTSGATDLTPEQQQRMESAIDGLITVAALRAGQGIRNEVSPEMREMIRKDIVLALSEGIRGDLGASLEETVDRVMTRAMTTVKQELRDDDLKYALSDVLRESIYIAMREGQGGTPAVGDTLEETLTTNMLQPFERSVGSLADNMVAQVDMSARRTEQTLKGVIGALIVVSFLFIVLYMIRGRQLARAQESTQAAMAAQRSVSAALDLLDETTRARILDKVQEYRQVAEPLPGKAGSAPLPAPQPPTEKPPSDDYLR